MCRTTAALILMIAILATSSWCWAQKFNYGPYRDGESPKSQVYPLPSALEQDIEFLAGWCSGIRTYSVANTHFLIPEICEQYQLKCCPGAWIGKSHAENELEIELLTRIAKKKLECVDTVIVGNEVLYRKDIPPAQLRAYVTRVKEAVKVRVAVADTWFAWLGRETPHSTEGEPSAEVLAIATEADVMMVQIYAYWDGIPIEQAPQYTIERFQQVREQYKKKRVVLSEFGWPSAGRPMGKAVPSPEHQARYFREIAPLLKKHNIDAYWFVVFDEAWKVDEPNGVGPNFGLFHADGSPKMAARECLPDKAQSTMVRPARRTKFQP